MTEQATQSDPRGDHDSIAIEVAYALPQRQLIVPLRVRPGTTIREAIELSGIRDQFENLVVDEKNVGIFSKRHDLDHVLEHGDRVEIYRPLQVDPKEARRALARKKGEAGKEAQPRAPDPDSRPDD